MKPIPDIVKEYVIKKCGRMPETDKEIDDYLDLINHAKEYAESVRLKSLIGLRMMKRLGFKTPDEIKKKRYNSLKRYRITIPGNYES